MIRRFAYMCIGFALLIVSGAEAMAGHCSQSVKETPQIEMSAHCAEMMQADTSMPSHGDGETDTSVCCCVVMAAPVLFEVSSGDAQLFLRSSWRLSLLTAGQSIPPKVAIPPPRI